MMLILVALYFITFLPNTVYLILGNKFNLSIRFDDAAKYYRGVTNMGQAANSCINILVYTAMSP